MGRRASGPEQHGRYGVRAKFAAIGLPVRDLCLRDLWLCWLPTVFDLPRPAAFIPDLGYLLNAVCV